jgi:hypothetical protein
LGAARTLQGRYFDDASKAVLQGDPKTVLREARCKDRAERSALRKKTR